MPGFPSCYPGRAILYTRIAFASELFSIFSSKLLSKTPRTWGTRGKRMGYPVSSEPAEDFPTPRLASKRGREPGAHAPASQHNRKHTGHTSDAPAPGSPRKRIVPAASPAAPHAYNNCKVRKCRSSASWYRLSPCGTERIYPPLRGLRCDRGYSRVPTLSPKTSEQGWGTPGWKGSATRLLI